MKRELITAAILFLMFFSLASAIRAEGNYKLLAKNDVWSVLQGNWTNEQGGELNIKGREIEYFNVILEPPEDINAPMSDKIIEMVGIKGTLEAGDKDEFGMIYFKVTGSLIVFDAQGNTKKEIKNYKNEKFFWIKFPDTEYTIIPCGTRNGIEPGLSKVL